MIRRACLVIALMAPGVVRPASAGAEVAPDSAVAWIGLPPAGPRPGPIPWMRADGTLQMSVASSGFRPAPGSIGQGHLRLGAPQGPTLEIDAGLLVARSPGAVTVTAMRNAVRAAWTREGRTLWIGSAFERQPADGAVSPPLLGLGMRASRAEFDVAASIEQTLQSVRRDVRVPVVIDSIPSFTIRTDEGTRPVTSARVDLRWTRGRIAVETVAGLTMPRAAAARRWMQTAWTVTLTPAVAVRAALGSPPPRWLALDAAPGHRASLGLCLSPTRASVASRGDNTSGGPPLDWALVRTRAGRHTIQVRAPGARRVEVMGDFTGWTPVLLRRVSATRWEVTMAIPPGVHEVAIRRDDGPWAAPPGLPTTVDGFSGVAGVLLVE